MKKLMILGSVKYFENLVLTAKKLGIYTIVCDSRENTPAKLICDEAITIDITNLEELKRIAIEKKIDGIITSFTDTLLKPYVYIANELNLPCILNTDQLISITNKQNMKKIFTDNNIPTTNYCSISSKNELFKISTLSFPLVMKPTDSCGSKGIYFVQSLDDILLNIDMCLSYSSSNSVLFEEYYESDEVQGLAWVHNGECHLLYIGDRELVYPYTNRPGKPERLIYPSKYCYQYEDSFKKIYQQIAIAFNIKNGPIYAQLLIGCDGIKVCEIMTRLPGGCDYLAVQEITDYDIGETLIKFSLNEDINFEKLKNSSINLKKVAYALPIFLSPGKISKVENIDFIESQEYISSFLLNSSINDEIPFCGDLRQDFGRFFGTAKNLFHANKIKDFVHSSILITDEHNNNMIENF